MIIDFHDISGPKSSKQDNFQELCSQLVLREHPEAKSIDGRGGDAGLDIYEGALPSRPEVVWQAKLFYNPIKQPQKRQIIDSFQKVAKIPSLTKWILCLPRNLNPSEEGWLQSLKSSLPSLGDRNSAVTIEWWGESKLRELLVKHQDIADQFFNMEPQVNIFSSGSAKIENKQVVIQRAESGATINIINYTDGVADSPLPNVRRIFAEGHDCYVKKRWHEAIEKFERCIEVEKDHQRLSALNLLVGNCYYRLNQYLTATEFYTKALREAKKVSNREAEAFALANIGYTYTLRTAPNTLSRGKNIRLSVKYLKSALRLLNRDEHPTQYADIQNSLAEAYIHLPLATPRERDRNVRSSIEYCQAALEVFRRNEFPAEYAETQNSIGNSYMQLSSRTSEEREQNVRKAVECYQLALEVRDKYAYPVSYAMAQNNLGNAYRELASETPGKHGLNVRKAVEYYQASLETCSKDEYPLDYASAQNNLGSAYLELPSATPEEREQNVCKAMACHRAAREVYKKDDYPIEYASNQNNLGHAYLESSPATLEEREQNVRNAVACHHAALEVYGKAKYSVEHAITQNSLANAYLAYSELSSITFKDQLQNIRKAVECLQVSLKVWRKDRYPLEHAAAQNNLGGAYIHLPSTTLKDRLQNVRKAVACYQASLEVWRKDKYPLKYAVAQNNLGGAYLELPSPTPENRIQNIHKALACYQAALEFLRKDEHPFEYASCQNNLAKAYLKLPSPTLDERIRNVRKAVDCYHVLLQIYTKANHPQKYCFIAANVGMALASIDDGKACDWLREVYDLKAYLQDDFVRRVEEILSTKCRQQ